MEHMKWSDLEVGDKIVLTEEAIKVFSYWADQRRGPLLITEANTNHYTCDEGEIFIRFATESNGFIGEVRLDKYGDFRGTHMFKIIELREEVQ